jgi:hypothetical protein
VEDHEPFVDRPGRELPLVDEVGAVGIDAFDRDRLQVKRAELGIKSVFDHAAIVRHGGRSALSIVFDVPEPLRARIRENRSGPQRTFEGSAAGVGQDRGQRLLRQLPSEMTSRRTAFRRPCRAEPLPNLARQARPVVPGRAACSALQVDVPRDRGGRMIVHQDLPPGAGAGPFARCPPVESSIRILAPTRPPPIL